jgi:hypothetical protein
VRNRGSAFEAGQGPAFCLLLATEVAENTERHPSKNWAAEPAERNKKWTRLASPALPNCQAATGPDTKSHEHCGEKLPGGADVALHPGAHAFFVGAGGLWGGFGWLWTERRGIAQMYVSRTEGLVWIERRGGRPWLITPEEPEAFVRALWGQARAR